MSDLPHTVTTCVLRLCEDIATPRALTVAILLRYKEWDQLANLEVDPMRYSRSEDYWRDATVTSILRKLEGLPTTIDRKAVAVENFWKSEEACCRTNIRLATHLEGALLDPRDEHIAAFIGRVRGKIADILGPCPDLNWGKFGPGATYGDKGQFSTIPDKMSSRPTLTSDAWAFLVPWTGTLWAQACASSERSPEFIRGNRFTTVPKDCKRDRGIAVEPSINSFYQLAVGRILKNRIKRAGLDLSRAQDIHRQVACEASLQGHLATLDLSNASDTVSSSLVKLLLPHKWYDLLSSLRSPATLIGGKWVRLEKFSSMGNGFTFELETLLFFAIAHECYEAEGEVPQPGINLFVFGDDIIVPTPCSENVISALRYFGFETNKAKSFVSGPFRESCGGDFFQGVDVRPYFLKELPIEPQQFIAMANGIRRLGRDDLFSVSRSRCLRRAWFCVLDALPSWVRGLRGPEGLGDLVIHDVEERWRFRWRSSIRYIRCYRPARYRKVAWSLFRPDVVLAGAVYGVPWGGGGIIPRDAVSGYKVGWVPFS